jgi:hypothetical protein
LEKFGIPSLQKEKTKSLRKLEWEMKKMDLWMSGGGSGGAWNHKL